MSKGFGPGPLARPWVYVKTYECQTPVLVYDYQQREVQPNVQQLQYA